MMENYVYIIYNIKYKILNLVGDDDGLSDLLHGPALVHALLLDAAEGVGLAHLQLVHQNTLLQLFLLYLSCQQLLYLIYKLLYFQLLSKFYNLKIIKENMYY